MNLFKKLFGSKDSTPATNKNGAADTASKTAQLKAMVEPLLVNATKIICEKPSRPPEDSRMLSHFGGEPYFETGEEWPKSKTGVPLNFVFQVFNEPDTHLPENIRLVQFYYDYEASPWSTEDDGWLVKIYEKTNPDNMAVVAKPEGLENTKFCSITLQNIKSLPDWDGLDLHCSAATEIAEAINDDEPWEVYDTIATELTGADPEDSVSQFGGYPKWIQGESTPQDNNGNNLPLLFQIDSEENAGIMWGDTGMVYVFYDAKRKQVEFELQCF